MNRLPTKTLAEAICNWPMNRRPSEGSIDMRNLLARTATEKTGVAEIQDLLKELRRPDSFIVMGGTLEPLISRIVRGKKEAIRRAKWRSIRRRRFA